MNLKLNKDSVIRKLERKDENRIVSGRSGASYHLRTISVHLDGNWGEAQKLLSIHHLSVGPYNSWSVGRSVLLLR